MADDNGARWVAVAAVRDWLAAAGLPRADRPTLSVPLEARQMVCELVDEECGEFRAAVEAGDLVEVADAVADLLWVTIEAGTTFGVPIEAVFEEVRRSNWTKLRTGQRVVTGSGKIVAGPGFSPPDLRPILEAFGASTRELDHSA